MLLQCLFAFGAIITFSVIIEAPRKCLLVNGILGLAGWAIYLYTEQFTSVLMATFMSGLVLAIMIFPTITSVSADAIRSVPKDYRMGAYGMGSTRWQTIYKIVLPASASGIFSGIILGLARAFGEALAVAMVIGQTTALPDSIFSTTKSLTTEITAQMGNAMEGGETKTALWTLALLLFLISLLFIFLIHFLSAKQSEESGNKKKGAKTN